MGALRVRLRRRRRRRLAAAVMVAIAGLALAGPGPGMSELLPRRLLPGTGARPVVDPDATTGPDHAPGPDSLPGPRPGHGTRLGLGPDERAVALALPLALPPVEPGDPVDLIALSNGADGAVTALTLAGPVRILAVDDRAVTVAVPAGEVESLLRHQAGGAIELALRP